MEGFWTKVDEFCDLIKSKFGKLAGVLGAFAGVLGVGTACLIRGVEFADAWDKFKERFFPIGALSF